MQCRLPRRNVPFFPPIVEISATYHEDDGMETGAVRYGRISNLTRGGSTTIKKNTTIECYVGDTIRFYTDSYNGNDDSNNYKDDTWIKLDGTIVAQGTTSKNASFSMEITNPIKAQFSTIKGGSYSNCSCVTISITTL